MSRLALALTLLLAVPCVAATSAEIVLEPGAAPRVSGGATVNASTPGESYLLDLVLLDESNYVNVTAQPGALALAWARQLVPSLLVNETKFPLFADVPFAPYEREPGVPLSNATLGNGTLRLSLAIPGPQNVTLRLARDATPPTVEPGPVGNLTHFSFYQETRTNELAIVNLQVRKPGESEWIDNPTPEFHVRQRFPIQGLPSDATVEVRLVAEDWAGNRVVLPVYTVRTLPAPVLPAPIVTPTFPAKGASDVQANVTISARIDSPESPVPRDGLRLFVDKRAVLSFTYDGLVLRYQPTTPLEPGFHTVLVEAENEAGGRANAQWSFTVGRDGIPGLAPLALVGALVVVASLRRR